MWTLSHHTFTFQRHNHNLVLNKSELCSMFVYEIRQDSERERERHDWGTPHFFHSRKLICEPETSLLSRAMGHMLLLHVGGPFKYYSLYLTMFIVWCRDLLHIVCLQKDYRACTYPMSCTKKVFISWTLCAYVFIKHIYIFKETRYKS